MDPGKLDPAMKGNSGNGCLRDVDTHPELGVGCCLAEEKKIDFLGILPPRRKTLEKDERKNKEQKKKEEENGTGPILLPSGMSTFMAFHWL